MSSPRRPLRDNTRLLLAGIGLLLALLIGLVLIAQRTARLSPDVLTEAVLYALSATNLMMLVALGFVLARNVVKVVVERQRAMPFAKFRAKLVFALTGMALVPAVLVLIVGSQVVRTAVERWFNAPMEEVLASANRIAGDYYEDRRQLAAHTAARVARRLAAAPAADPAALEAVLAEEVSAERVNVLQVYRSDRDAGDAPVPLARAEASGLAPRPTWADTGAYAARLLAGENVPATLQTVQGGGDVVLAGARVVDPQGRTLGVVVASDYLAGDLAERSRRMSRAFEDYTQLRVLKGPLTSVYLSFFVMLTLMILVAATWMGSYLAKRITRPVQMLSVAARQIGAGHYDLRLEHRSPDEFGGMVDAFNSMAAELGERGRQLEEATRDLQRKHETVEARRHYVETVLERVATGVISLDPQGRIETVNAAAFRLLQLDSGALAQPAAEVFDRPDLQPLNAVLERAARARGDSFAQELSLDRADRELHLAVVATRLLTADGTSEGTVLVLDDVTPLIRAQKVAAWREVARRLAHEIKNPLTPIQLSAERIRRKLGGSSSPHASLVDECTSTIVGEVESLKGLVDEFSQFARMPAPRAAPTDLHAMLHQALALYDGLFAQVAVVKRFASVLPPVRVDAEQIRRVVINLVDNAIEAMDQHGTIVVATAFEPSNHLVRITIEDDGPGVPAAERDKLFLPYYSTKGRGSGLGLAIVRRIIVEHGGSIEAADNHPRGTRFTIELPVAGGATQVA